MKNDGEEAYIGAALLANDRIFPSQDIPELISELGLTTSTMDAYNTSHDQPTGICYRLIWGGIFYNRIMPPHLFARSI